MSGEDLPAKDLPANDLPAEDLRVNDLPPHDHAVRRDRLRAELAGRRTPRR